MTGTLTTPDVTTDSVEDLDFPTPCSVRFAVLGKPVGRPCEHPAKWSGRLPCCGVVGLLCDKHFADRFTKPFYCGACHKTHKDLIGWQRI